jgi:hypothetical protein
VISYAIADLAAFVRPDGPIDREAHRRGTTLYAPDSRTRCIRQCSAKEQPACCPNDPVRPAPLVDNHTGPYAARMLSAEVARARVRSRTQLSYDEAQDEIDCSTPRETLGLLKLVGQWREHREQDRGGVSLKLPQQEIQPQGNGWTLRFRAPEPIEAWNAQISLLTGMAAAHIRLYGEVGILRTMPPADAYSLVGCARSPRPCASSGPRRCIIRTFVRSLHPTRPIRPPCSTPPRCCSAVLATEALAAASQKTSTMRHSQVTTHTRRPRCAVSSIATRGDLRRPLWGSTDPHVGSSCPR